jgi:hypothetical protein
LDQPRLDLTPNQKASVNVVFKNTGKTPARDLAVVGFVALGQPVPDDLNKLKAPSARECKESPLKSHLRGVVFPDTVYSVAPTSDKVFSEPNIANVFANRAAVYLVGCLEYDGGWLYAGIRRRTNYCEVYITKRDFKGNVWAGFFQCPSGNSAD